MENLNKPVVILIFASLLSINTIYAQERAVANLSIEHNIDRPGGDYERFEMDDPEPGLCVEACKNDPNCKAFTFIKPGIQGEKAVCYLKNEIAPPIENPDCISGIKADIPVQEEQIWKPAGQGIDHSQIRDNPQEMIEMPPADLVVMKADLNLSREDVIKSAESNPELNQQLTKISRLSGINLGQLYTRTLSGDKALETIDKGKSNDYSKNLGRKGAPTDPTQIDWSGEIRLTPNKCFSNEGIWYNNYYKSVAEMNIIGIYASSANNINDMARADFAYVFNGHVEVFLNLPNTEPELYLITLHVHKWQPILADYIYLWDNNKPKNSPNTKLYLNAASDKYSGLIKISGSYTRLVSILYIYRWFKESPSLNCDQTQFKIRNNWVATSQA